MFFSQLIFCFNSKKIQINLFGLKCQFRCYEKKNSLQRSNKRLKLDYFELKIRPKFMFRISSYYCFDVETFLEIEMTAIPVTAFSHLQSCKLLQCPSLNMITLCQHKSDNNNRMIPLTDIFCLLFRYNGTSNI